MQNGVCSTVKYTKPYVFGVDEPLYIQKGGLGRFYCDNNIKTSYCVTSNYLIVSCGDIGCEKTTGGVNACSTSVSEADCTFRNSEIMIDDALIDIEIYWDDVMGGIEFWLTKWGGAVGMDILSQIWGSKSIIIDAIKQKVGTRTTMTPTSFKKVVVDAIKAAVPASGKVFLNIGKGIAFPFLVWDVMNWDIFVVKTGSI